MAIASKISAGSAVVVDQIKMDSPKTAVCVALKAMGGLEVKPRLWQSAA
jgi:ribosomal protein L4